MNADGFWIKEFGDVREARDYAGRKILRARFARYGDRFGWAVERIFSDGCDFESNLHIVNVAAEIARYGRSQFFFEGAYYAVAKSAATEVPYDYRYKDFCVTRLDEAGDLWRREFGDAESGLDFAGRRVVRILFGADREGGWNVDHILPLAKNGEDHAYNLQIASVAANSAKADKLEFGIEGARYRVKRTVDTTEEEWYSTPYDYRRKDYCVIKDGVWTE